MIKLSATLVFIGAAVIAVIAAHGVAPDSYGFVVPQARRIADVPLRTVKGGKIFLARNAERTTLVLGYVACSDACPATLRSLHANPHTKVAFLDIDPWDDSPQRVAAFLRAYPDVEGIVGDLASLRATEISLGVRPIQRQADVENHDGRTFVVESGGVVLRR